MHCIIIYLIKTLEYTPQRSVDIKNTEEDKVHEGSLRSEIGKMSWVSISGSNKHTKTSRN